ncbi:small ubiquitin-related modifier 1-like [Herrania umbratica]|uniref:Small ubiquitin-related modifier n=1 Tax=Herrania umbratica TaxID=108875 RepID=A0A6J1AY97_9ROSI|nr:small ubiquitin-related modifier 1-like [Herrania umbratica]
MSSSSTKYQPTARVRITIKNQDGEEAYYQMKRTTPLRKLMNAHCSKFSFEPNTVAFLFDGRRLNEDETPEQVKMEDMEEVDCMIHQVGGYRVHSA